VVQSTINDRCWRWVLHDGGPAAFAGFLVLIAVWSLRIVLPINLLLGWAGWLGTKAVGGSPTSDLNGTTGTGSSGLALLYVVTIPLALLAYALRFLLGGLRPAMIAFVLAAAGRFGYQSAVLLDGTPATYTERVAAMNQLWQGAYGTVGLHRVFAAPWQAHYPPARRLAHHFADAPFTYQSFTSHPTAYPDVVWLLVWDAVMFALIAAALWWLLIIGWRLVHQIGTHTEGSR
jgi:hypothetical protein